MALATLTAAGAADALTVDYDALPRGDVAELLRAPERVDQASPRKVQALVIENGQILAKDEDGPTLCFSDGRRSQKDSFAVPSTDVPIRVEQIVDRGAGTAALRVRWIVADAARTNALSVGEEELGLALVGKAPTGVKVYAMRDESDTVQFIVAGPERPKRLRKGNQVDDRQLVLSDVQRPFTDNRCGHVIVPLEVRARRPMAATVRNTVILSTTVRPHGATADVRVRGMYSHLSVSKLSKDETPVVSVSFGWATAETIVEAVLDEE
jgi:hypothetical protein